MLNMTKSHKSDTGNHDISCVPMLVINVWHHEQIRNIVHLLVAGYRGCSRGHGCSSNVKKISENSAISEKSRCYFMWRKCGSRQITMDSSKLIRSCMIVEFIVSLNDFFLSGVIAYHNR